jgi:hypothetical protein
VVEECNMAEGELGVEEGDECHGWRIIRCGARAWLLQGVW